MLAAVLAAVVTLAACDANEESARPADSPAAAFPGRLAVLEGAPGDRRLVALDAAGARTTIALPAGDVSWISIDATGALAATRAGGAVLVAPSSTAAWRAVDLGGSLDRLDGRPLLATWSPDGRLAALVGDPETARIAAVLVIDPATDGTYTLGLDLGLEGSAPAWLDASLVAVPAREQDAPVLLVVDTAGGPPRAAMEPARTIVASPDGATIALVRGDAREVEVWRAGPWLQAWRTASTPPAGARLATLRPPAGAVRPTAIAVDRTGDHLAVAWGDADGTSRSVTVHDEVDGWSVVSRLAIEPTEAVPALGWLP